ncbi:hypothetical protein D5S18_25790 [Nocardia panacis]|uniref:HAD family hydrolase n=1 Tax=Nocardia panacis TaxID=2340916 RepID=A0A3A4K2H6_9NOCA|nr:haloacid dehalogenase-like hydrolase [Nocardia panacis]RJO70634.1 hypothetical protein D5S18_25790 [Nocardia panacis]
MKYAILDMDGTLFPGVLGAHYLRNLIDDGVCHRDAATACLAAIEQYGALTARRDRVRVLHTAYEAYAAAMEGVAPTAVRSTAARTWAACRGRLYPFATDLIELLRGAEYRLHLISGSAHPLVQEVVVGLGLDAGWGAMVAVENGRHTRDLVYAPGYPGGKAVIMRRLVDDPEFDGAGSFAIGNSVGDAEVFEHVGSVIAFEPDAELRALAASRSWSIADRDTVVQTCARLIGVQVTEPLRGSTSWIQPSTT